VIRHLLAPCLALAAAHGEPLAISVASNGFFRVGSVAVTNVN
jgi:hypothetical protein